MSAPFIWIVLPFITSLVLLVVRRNFRLACLIQFTVSVILLLLLSISHIGEVDITRLVSVYIDPELSVLGRSFILNKSDKFIIAFLYIVLASWTIVLYVFDKPSKIVPLGLAFSALLLSAIAVDPFLYSALIIEIAVILSIIILVDISNARSKGIIRYLIFFTLGMPFILLAGWYLSGGETSPINDDQLLQATILLGLGFVFWLAIFPFHSWIPLIMEESEIQDGIYVLTVLPFSIFIIFMKYLNGFVWLRDYEIVYKALLLVGVIMVLAGSIWAIFQKSIKKMIGYLTITFTGYILIALGLNTNQGFILFSELQLPRLVSYLLITVSMISIERDLNLDAITDLKSIFYSHNFASIGLLVSFFTLVGMPLTAGFPALQLLYQAVSSVDTTIMAIMLVGSGLLTVFFIRLFLDIIHPVEDDYEIVESKEHLIEKIMIGSLIFLLIVIGIFPNMVYSQFDQLMNSFEFLIK